LKEKLPYVGITPKKNTFVFLFIYLLIFLLDVTIPVRLKCIFFEKKNDWLIFTIESLVEI